MSAAPILRVQGLTTRFPVHGGVFGRVVGHVHAVEDVSFSMARGEIVGLVGESGSGKTTVGRSLLRLAHATAGTIEIDGVDIARLPAKDFQPYRRKVQIIFQDPFASLDPRMKVGRIIGEALTIHGLGDRATRRDRIVALLGKVGLPPDAMNRFPHQFSGGQRQRIGIARALAVEPSLIIADEPVSALDVSVQAQVINLLQDLQEEFSLSMLFIAHDLGVVRHVCDRVIVMYLGHIMEQAPSAALYRSPKHPYTKALLSAIPIADPQVRSAGQVLQGDIPSPIHPPSGCVFRTRCPHAIDACSRIVPPPIQAGESEVACLRPEIFDAPL